MLDGAEAEQHMLNNAKAEKQMLDSNDRLLHLSKVWQ